MAPGRGKKKNRYLSAVGDALVDGAGRRCCGGRSITSSASATGALREFKRDGGMAGAARCSAVRVRSSPLRAGKDWSRPRHGTRRSRAGPGRPECGRRPSWRGVRRPRRRRVGAATPADRRAAVRPRRWHSHRCDADARRDRHEQARLQFWRRFVERPAVGFEIEPHGRSGDTCTSRSAERGRLQRCRSLEPSAHDVQCVLGGIEQDPPGPWTVKWRRHAVPAATRRRSRARKDCQHLGSPPMIPTACSDHSRGDEPALLLGALDQAIAGSTAIGSSPPSGSGFGLGGWRAGLEDSFSSI